MNLPRSIQKILDDYPVQSYEGELIQAVAHEACRLQREAHVAAWGDQPYDAVGFPEAPLVVPGLDCSFEDQKKYEPEPEPEIDRSKLPRCPICYTNGHQHRKDCRYRDFGMQYHVKSQRNERS